MATIEVDGLIDAICEMQAAITPPASEKPLAKAWDEPPANPGEFPCFINVEQSIENIQLTGSHRHMDHMIDMHLVLAPTDQKYDVRARRKWVQPVLDYFQGTMKLERHVQNVSLSRIEQVTFEPISLNDKEYVTATFTLRVRVDDGFSAGP